MFGSLLSPLRAAFCAQETVPRYVAFLFLFGSFCVSGHATDGGTTVRWHEVERTGYSQPANCGAMCLQKVVAYLGVDLSLKDAEALTGTDPVNGARMLDLALAARRLGLSAEGYRVERTVLRDLPLPAILHSNDRHFFVLEELRLPECRILNPGIGEVTILLDDLVKNWDGTVLLVQKMAQNSSGPNLVFDNYFVDLGAVDAGATVKKELTFYNKGDRLLLIEGVQSSCACVKEPILSKMEISPGEKGTLSISIKTPDTSGRFRTQFSVTSNDPDEGRASLTIAAQVDQPLIIAPARGRVLFGRVPEGKEKTEYISFGWKAPGEDAKITKVEAPSEFFSWKVLESQGESRFQRRLALTLKPDAPPGEFCEVLCVYTNLTGRPICIQARGEVFRCVEVSPSCVHFGLIPAGARASRILTLHSESGFLVDSVLTRRGLLKCELLSEEICMPKPSMSYRLTLHATEKQGILRDTVVFCISKPRLLELEVPVYAWFE
ncbi:MAG: cysteine peptidase family C39 domain-containing protein [Candidatus Hydrogenedentales bacterium]